MRAWMIDQFRRVRRHLLQNSRVLPLLLLAGLVVGCFVYFPEDRVMFGPSISDLELGRLKPGTATREQVLHLHGRPSTRYYNDRFFFYSSYVATGALTGMAPGGIGGSRFHGQKTIVLEFEADGRLVRVDRFDTGDVGTISQMSDRLKPYPVPASVSDAIGTAGEK